MSEHSYSRRSYDKNYDVCVTQSWVLLTVQAGKYPGINYCIAFFRKLEIKVKYPYIWNAVKKNISKWHHPNRLDFYHHYLGVQLQLRPKLALWEFGTCFCATLTLFWTVCGSQSGEVTGTLANIYEVKMIFEASALVEVCSIAYVVVIGFCETCNELP